jgi:hypothetical protein
MGMNRIDVPLKRHHPCSNRDEGIFSCSWHNIKSPKMDGAAFGPARDLKERKPWRPCEDQIKSRDENVSESVERQHLDQNDATLRFHSNRPAE